MANISNVLSGIVAENYAERVGVPDDEQSKFLVLGYALGARPVGLAITLALANQQAEQAPPPATQPTDLTVTTKTLPDATVGQGYRVVLKAAGGQPPYSWKETSGDLPNKMTLVASTGVLQGTAATGDVGEIELVVQVSDAADTTASQDLTLNVVAKKKK